METGLRLVFSLVAVATNTVATVTGLQFQKYREQIIRRNVYCLYAHSRYERSTLFGHEIYVELMRNGSESGPATPSNETA